MDEVDSSITMTENVDGPGGTNTEISRTSFLNESTSNIIFGKQKRKKMTIVPRNMDQIDESINMTENVDRPIGTNTEISTSFSNESISNIISGKQKRKKMTMVPRNMDQAAVSTNVTENVDNPEEASSEIADTSVTNESISNIMPVKQKRKKLVKVPRNRAQAAANVNVTENVDVPVETSTEVTESSVTNENTDKTASNKQKRNKSVMTTRTMLQSMVMNSLKAFEKQNGASFEDVRKYMKEKYPVDMKIYKNQVNKFLQKSVDKGLIERIDGANAEERFKFKKSENSRRELESLRRKSVQASVRKATASKKQN